MASNFTCYIFHKGADFSRVVTGKANNFVRLPLLMSTRSIYMSIGSSYLLHKQRILILKNTYSYFDCLMKRVTSTNTCKYQVNETGNSHVGNN